jgi:hypothetical protein
MERKEFRILIDAPKERVWEILWGPTNYPAWTSEFMEGSRVESINSPESQVWKQGNKVRFLGPDNEGMVSMVAENKPNERMSFKHLGVVMKGVEDLDSPQSREWAGSMENYTLKPVGDKTELIVDMDITPEFLEYFQKTWPKALEKIKELSEQK